MKKALIISIAFNFIIIFLIAAKRYYYSIGNAAIANQNEFYNHWNEMRLSVYNIIPIDAKDIVFVGNSLTEGFPVTEMFGYHVKNRGIGGNQTSHIIKRITPIAAKHPAKLFIEIGVNDLNAGVTVDSVFKNYRQIIDIIRDTSPKTLIYVQSVFPTGKQHSKVNPAIVQLNKLLSVYCTAIGVKYIDIHAILLHDGQLNEQFTDDGIHLNGSGYQVWKEAVEKYLR